MGKNIKTLEYRYEYNGKEIKAKLKINLGRFDGQYSKAQYALDSMVMTSMQPFMPMVTGQFINVTKGMSAAIAGSGKVVAAAPPFGRFLYEGKVMVGERTRSAYAAKGERKVVTGANLEYSHNANPQAQAHWFDAAKKKDGKTWIRRTRFIAGGNK